MSTSKINPTKKYFVEKGRNKGTYLGKLMFNNYGFLKSHLVDLESKLKPKERKSSYHMYLEWLLKQGENRKVKSYCPICNIRVASQILICRNSNKEMVFNVNHISCSEDHCQTEIEKYAKIQNTARNINLNVEIDFTKWSEIKFSTIGEIGYRKDQDRFVNMLTVLFDFPYRNDSKKIHEFFLD